MATGMSRFRLRFTELCNFRKSVDGKSGGLHAGFNFLLIKPFLFGVVLFLS